MSRNTSSSTPRLLYTRAVCTGLPTMRGLLNFFVFTRPKPLNVRMGMILVLSIGPEKVLEKPQPGLLAFFGMELGGKYILLPDGGYDVGPIIHGCRDHVLVIGHHVVSVDKIIVL